MDNKQPRALSHDEKKAAEAAYQGKPFHSSWSKSSRAVYDGIIKARGLPIDALESAEMGVDPFENPMVAEGMFEEALSLGTSPGKNAESDGTDSQTPAHQITSRQEAIDAGLLIDVTNKAKGVGFNLSVGITKSLWNRSIAETLDSANPEGEARIRDMLLAVRLRLASLDAPSPWVEVPVLYPSQQEEGHAKIFPIYALFHKDAVAEECLTLIHPKEISSIRPSTHSNTEEEQSSTDFL
ncbi:hypothetical protein [Candidatus Nitronereus thalassa]|uniref:Uncharacterized protein n=1 Tax=Candidatus Nitronereus thalassa TaxID=3020898 RepID=A0ABU3KAP6_9BACT|nr:hypothetical protein [Candidatus Nitronereus thalassa]MDT7043388.1 hypothetical protein [Candidatus Nitronereus thalassa]